ncbi:MAG: site-specific integrase, partial [Betaproteobacteria bacterium]
MATIERRLSKASGNSYRAKIRLKGYPVQSATFERLTDARKWVQQTESAIREGRHFKTTESKRHTLAELIDRYVRDVTPAKKSAKDQVQQLGWWKNAIGSYALADVSPSLLAECRDKLGREITVRGKPRSPASIVRYLAALSHAFTIAVKEWGWMEDNPMRKV